jgi:hypothetical protein
MNGLKPELKTIVMTKEPTNVEELRHSATLAEKAISSNTVNTISQTVLEEIQTLKDQLKSINIVQDVPPQTDNSYGSFVITMVFNSGFNPFMATARNMSSDIFLFVAN